MTFDKLSRNILPCRRNRWRFFQFRLRTILIFFVFSATGLCWWTNTVLRQHRAIELLNTHGGDVRVHDVDASPSLIYFFRKVLALALDEDYFTQAYAVCLPYQCLAGTDRLDLSQLEYLTALEELDAGSSSISDTDLECVDSLTNLERLDLSNTAITDRGLMHLRESNQLVQLNLNDTIITDLGLESIENCVEMRVLLLGNTLITDVGLEHLQALTEMQELNLSSTSITDAGLEKLKNMRSLQIITINDTKITNRGIAFLNQYFPNCKVYR